MNLCNFFAELKRRNVYKVAVAYAIVGWLLVRVAPQALIIALAVGLPIAVILNLGR